MKLGVFFFGGVRMPDAGNDGPLPVNRRYSPAQFAEAYDDLKHWAVTADGLGYDSLWLTEHHLQYEGYEVMPNCIMVGAVLAQHTQRLRFGAMFNIVPQWHPLKLAEDFAVGDIMSGGRLIMGVGRGTVVREALCFGTTIGATDWDSVGHGSAAAIADATNRAQFEEGMEILRRAFTGEPFSFHGHYYDLPPLGTPDRGRFIDTITLVPSPIHKPVEIWQPVTSPATVEYVAKHHQNAVFWNHGYAGLPERWAGFADASERAGRTLARGEGRMLIVNVHLADSVAGAIASARNGHDEFTRFLAPYARKPGEKGSSGHSGRSATLEDSIAQRSWFVGPPETVAADLAEIIDELGVEHLTVMVHWPGMGLEVVDEQLRAVATDLVPRIERAVRVPSFA